MTTSTTDQAKLDKRVQEAVALGEANGWEMLTERLDVEGCPCATGIGGVFPLAGRKAFAFTMALGINPHTGRVVTLRHGRKGAMRAATLITLEEAGRETGQAWASNHSRAWRRALLDPIDWTDYESEPVA